MIRGYLLSIAILLFTAGINQAIAEEKFDPLALFEKEKVLVPDGIGYSSEQPSLCFLAAEKGKILSLNVGDDQMKQTGEVHEVNFMSVLNGQLFYYFFDAGNNYQVCYKVSNQ